MFKRELMVVLVAAGNVTGGNALQVPGVIVAGLLMTMSQFAPVARAGDTDRTGQWSADFESAEALARENGIPLVIHFYAHWCGPCRMMESQVLNSTEVHTMLGTGIVGVKVNSDDRRDLVSRFDISVLPTDVIISPEGKILSKDAGTSGRSAYVDRLARFRVPSGVPADPDAAETAIPVMTKTLRREADKRIGLNGYSPVSLTETEEWKTGEVQFKYEFQGVCYRLSSAAELERFKASPDKFIPALHGCDPVSLVNDQVFQAGHLELGVIYQSKVFFFVSKKTRQEFLSNPEKFSRRQSLPFVAAES